MSISSKEIRMYAAEFLGTLTLALAVSTAILHHVNLTPLIAGLTLALFVYSVGNVSGTHINPAVTIGLLTIRKISLKNAVGYIIAQYLGAAVAMVLTFALLQKTPNVGASVSLPIFLAEAIGAFILVFGISSVVHNKVSAGASGVVVGGSLVLGIFIAVTASNAVLNPAVAFAIDSVNIVYVTAPILGAILAAQVGKYIHA